MSNKRPVELAARLHNAGAVYVFYGAIDGLSLSYSMIKYLFDLLFTTGEISSADAMRDWMMSQEGMEAVAATSVSLVVFSMLANHFSDNDANLFKRYIAVVWPYGRDAMKGLKNAYKGVRSTLMVFELLNLTQDLSHLIVPVGLLLGGLSVLNRLWFRMLVGQDRKDMTKANTTLASAIQKGPGLSEEGMAAERKKINKHSERVRTMALLSAGYGGIVDGLYLYVGVLGICSLAPAVLEAMSVFCAIYFLACVATRIYEEYYFQQLLSISELRVELAIQGKGIESLLSQLASLNTDISKAREEEEVADLVLRRKKLVESIAAAVEKFRNQREELRSLSSLSYPTAVLAGLRNGLAAYGALASAMFAVSTLLVLSSTAFPPNLLVTCILLGMICLAGFVVQSVDVAHNHYAIKQEEKLFDDKFLHVSKILSQFKEENHRLCDVGNLDKIQQVVADGQKVEGLPQSEIMPWSEVGRSFFSGIGKGTKAIGFTLYALQEVDEHGRYHDTPIMMGLMMVSAVAHALILALRAFARGLGRPPVDAYPEEQATPNDSAVTDKQKLDVGSEHLDKIKTDASDVKSGLPASGGGDRRRTSIFGHHYATVRRSFFSASAPDLLVPDLTTTGPNTDLSSDKVVAPEVPSRTTTQIPRLRRTKSYSSFFFEEQPEEQQASGNVPPLHTCDDLILPSPYLTM
ncbi:TPA: hypothetical protein ACPSKE_000645 [Legionella feeleii]